MTATPAYLTLSDFNFEVPEHLVAQSPLQRRDDARLLIYRPGHRFAHSQVRQLSEQVPEGTLFILNDSRVIASRMHGSISTGAKIEILLIEPTGSGERERWVCLGRPMKKLARDTRVTFADGLEARVEADPVASDAGPQPFVIETSLKGAELLAWLERNGEMPLPPYISRKLQTAATKRMDKERYQTVYAKDEGSVAAPTAGLHLTSEVLNALKEKKCVFETVTLHVGAGTFLPVKVDDPARHIMHEERFLVPTKTLEAIRLAKSENRPVVVVGTTAFRSLEGLAKAANDAGKDLEELTDQWLRTKIFIRPEFASDRFHSWCADALMTNFHQPESTLFMMICSLLGYSGAKDMYSHAITQNFRFFSYGDSSLLWLR